MQQQKQKRSSTLPRRYVEDLELTSHVPSYKGVYNVLLFPMNIDFCEFLNQLLKYSKNVTFFACNIVVAQQNHYIQFKK